MLEKLMNLFRPKTSPALVMVLQQFGGGVHKRVDENRELLELLQQKAPSLLEECPQITGWLLANDEVFTALETMAEPLGAKNPRFCKRNGFPRSWPELPATQKEI